MIATISGIRGVLNRVLSLADVSRFARNFALESGSREFLLARDTRSTGPAITRAVIGALLSVGATVRDYGIISTPAVFRESRRRKLPAMMVTASHNEPQFNGLKFIESGAGIRGGTLGAVLAGEDMKHKKFEPGMVRLGRSPSYVDDLVEMYGEGSCDGVRVALDLGGGAAISHAVPLLGRLGCEVSSINDAPGVFSRRIDPVADDLELLRKVVKQKGCDVGFAFDCDGDRLVIVDSAGKKRTGDYMLTLALSALLERTGEKKVVVSQDTTQAADEVAKRSGARVFRSKVGEANVVGTMEEEGARLGGEGSSGGLIDGSFNYCRDSMLAAIAIARELKSKGRRYFDSVPVYFQERGALEIPRTKALKAIRKLAADSKEADLTDGLKVSLPNKAWVLIRPSGTEDVVRVSAEARTANNACRIVNSYSKKLKELSR